MAAYRNRAELYWVRYLRKKSFFARFFAQSTADKREEEISDECWIS